MVDNNYPKRNNNEETSGYRGGEEAAARVAIRYRYQLRLVQRSIPPLVTVIILVLMGGSLATIVEEAIPCRFIYRRDFAMKEDVLST